MASTGFRNIKDLDKLKACTNSVLTKGNLRSFQYQGFNPAAVTEEIMKIPGSDVFP